MKPRVYFESPFPGSQAAGYVDGDEITFELLRASEEVLGAGHVEYWGYQVTESYTRHLVDEAIVIAINDCPYDISLHGSKEKYLNQYDFRIDRVS